MIDSFAAQTPGRIPTEVPGLDDLLHGGLLPHGVYLLIGAAGAGKTTMANQIAFTYAAKAPVVYMTVLAETHTRLLGQIRQFTFFDPALISTHITYLSGYQAFQEGSYAGLSAMLPPLIRQHSPTLLVVDGVPLATPGASYDPKLKDLMHDLQAYSEFGHCTTLVVSPAHSGVWESRALMIVDGAIELTHQLQENALARTIQVKIFRGGNHESGVYPISFQPTGLVVKYSPPAAPDASAEPDESASA